MSSKEPFQSGFFPNLKSFPCSAGSHESDVQTLESRVASDDTELFWVRHDNRIDMTGAVEDNRVSFSHVQLFVDHVEDLEAYKALESQLLSFGERVNTLSSQALEAKRCLWSSLTRGVPDSNIETTIESFTPQNRDVVKQLLVGPGFRITGSHYDDLTRTVLVTSRDPAGVQILVTAVTPNSATEAAQPATRQEKSGSLFDAGK
jgi:hypothetical protein